MRRDELDDGSSVASSDENDEVKARLREALSARLAHSLEWDITPIQPQEPLSRKSAGDVGAGTGENVDDEDETDEDEPPETFAFRLFGSSKATTTVVLEKDRPFKPGEGNIVARRPISFYLSRPSAREREEYASVVMTWEQIMERSRQRMWGLERPWKTIATINSSDGKPKGIKKPGSSSATEGQDGGKGKRTRLGKKARIAKRKRDKATAAKKEAEEKAKLEKEEHIKAKKKRLNHVKKLRARAKAKAKKAAERGEAVADEGASDEGSADEVTADIYMEGM